MLAPRLLCAFTVLLCWVFRANLASAEISVEACAAAYTKGQEERLAGRLFMARGQFVMCSDPACPEAIVRDCARWKAEVEADLPTVLTEVVDSAGQPISGFALFINGEPVAKEFIGQSIVIDAGPHVFRIEAPGYETAQIERSFRPEDRNVALRIVLREHEQPKQVTEPGTQEPEVPQDTKPQAGRPFPTVPVVLASVGAVSLGASVYFGLSAINQFDELERSCAPQCTESDANSVQTKALISDITLGVGIAALGAAAFLYFTSDDQSTRTAVGFEPRADGARARVRLEF